MEQKDKSYDFDTIRKQVEYYLGDQNLRKDQFFRDLIENDPNGALPIDAILKCNKIKAQTSEPGIILEAIASSTFVEATADKLGVRRKDGSLPSYEPEVTKKIRTNDGTAHEVKNGNADNKSSYAVPNPVIFTLKTDKPYLGGRKQIQEVLEEMLKTKLPYVRYAKVEGNFVIDAANITEAQKKHVIDTGFSVGDAKFTVSLCEGEDLKTFWEKHGLHFKTCLGEKEKHERKEKKPKKASAGTQEITLGSQKYGSIEKLKMIFRNMLQQTSNGDVIKEPHHTMLLELLKFHENFEQKTKDLAHFSVNTHPEHKDSRCFLVVRKDGTTEDFSVKKCLENLEKKFQ